MLDHDRGRHRPGAGGGDGAEVAGKAGLASEHRPPTDPCAARSDTFSVAGRRRANTSREGVVLPSRVALRRVRPGFGVFSVWALAAPQRSDKASEAGAVPCGAGYARRPGADFSRVARRSEAEQGGGSAKRPPKAAHALKIVKRSGGAARKRHLHQDANTARRLARRVLPSSNLLTSAWQTAWQATQARRVHRPSKVASKVPNPQLRGKARDKAPPPCGHPDTS